VANIQAPPTWAEVVIVDKEKGTGSFNPVWLQWFLDVSQFINNSGGLSGAAHNNLSGLQGGSANEYYHLASALYTLLLLTAAGTYTPALTNSLNVAASTAYQCQYMRVGNTVTVSGKVDVDPTAGGAVQLGISLPIASNLGAVEDCAGVAAAPGIAGQSAAIVGNIANDRAEMQWVAVDVTNQPMYFTFSYQVI